MASKFTFSLKFVLVYYLVNSAINISWISSQKIGIKHQLSVEERSKLKSYVDKVTIENFLHLKRPNALSDFATLESFIQSKKMKSTTQQVMITIVIENYSEVRLINPIRIAGCKKNGGKPFNQDNVDPGSYEVYVIDNGGYFHSSVCGSISWQIEDESKNRRLIVTYEVPYISSCSSINRNSFSIRVANTQNKTNYKEENNYKNHHFDDPQNNLFSKSHKTAVIGMYDEKRFVIRGVMKGSCHDVLKIQFLPNPDLKKGKALAQGWEQKKTDNDLVETKESAPEEFLPAPAPVVRPSPRTLSPPPIGSEKGQTEEPVSRVMKIGLITLGSVMLAVVVISVCIVISVRRRRSKDKFFRRPYRQ